MGNDPKTTKVDLSKLIKNQPITSQANNNNAKIKRNMITTVMEDTLIGHEYFSLNENDDQNKNN